MVGSDAWVAPLNRTGQPRKATEVIYIVDNDDSYVFNIAQYFGATGFEVTVRRSDETSVAEICEADPDLVVISPGPGAPRDAGVSVRAVRDLAPHIPIFGICLGHQAIGEACGARIRPAKVPMHGKVSTVHHDGQGVFAGLANPIRVVRYHSLAVDADSVPRWLRVSAVSDDGEVMGLRHVSRPIESVQFHPESVFTEQGWRLMRNAALLRGSAPAVGPVPAQPSILGKSRASVPVRAQVPVRPAAQLPAQLVPALH